ncbi:MAG: DNA topoisomerase IB [Cyanobacteria bacterium P01_D01_bin.56]
MSISERVESSVCRVRMFPCPTVLYQDAAESAQLAGLRYVSDQQPGIQRQRWGRGFTYIDADDNRIPAGPQREWIQSLAIPPNWEEVWICSDPNGHLQATGRDARGRKQYRYHPDWIQLRNQLKFDRLIPFAQKLPILRKKIRKQLDNDRLLLNRDTVTAAVVQLLDDTLVRIGNTHYSQTNGSYGLTTLQKRHVDVKAHRLKFQFRGKSGVDHELAICDRKLATIIKRCQELPGYTLFQYIDEDNERQTIDSGDVNQYLQKTLGEAFTAKDFRAWGGTVAACQILAQPSKSSLVTKAIKAEARQLGNRPATCRKYYVHPRVIKAYESNWLLECWQNQAPNPVPELTEDEQRTLAVLTYQSNSTAVAA